ncbi:hypothetical protein GTY67_26215 [Streptomyces sp. SID8374]|uniref:hypothetical protein n=1 Tax=Streptomyces sp. SID8374 TaxID=2690354 RepID=UPI00136F62E6|nr:hypothetical protein [Streptomyces sp. SID8374]MYX16846.1 hypothetical protein [Streptomyces sp. SID8374]
MTTTLSPAEPLMSETLESTAIPVDLPSDTYRMLYRVVTGPLSPGDALDISGDARVTNDCGYPGGTRYTIGVGWHLWAYSYTDPARSAGPWWRVSHLMGDNVDPTRHHMPLHIGRWYRVPDDWPPGHRMVIVLRADAHSTAWKANGGKDTLAVDAGYGQLVVRPWCRTPNTPVEA